MTTTNPLDPNSPVRENDRMRLALQANGVVKDPRWVYILDIDCHGKGSLVYPAELLREPIPRRG